MQFQYVWASVIVLQPHASIIVMIIIYIMNMHLYVMLTLRVSANLNIGHNDEIHSSQPSVLSSAAVQRLGNWDYPLPGEPTQDVVLFINL